MKLKYDKLVSSFAFNFNLRHYVKGDKLCEPGVTAYDIKTELVEVNGVLIENSTTFDLTNKVGPCK